VFSKKDMMNKWLALSVLAAVMLVQVEATSAALVSLSAQAAEQRERAVVAATTAAIEKNRKSDVTLRIVDA
jgi:hypothetical protein